MKRYIESFFQSKQEQLFVLSGHGEPTFGTLPAASQVLLHYTESNYSSPKACIFNGIYIVYSFAFAYVCIAGGVISRQYFGVRNYTCLADS
jgi:hypothetical protein